LAWCMRWCRNERKLRAVAPESGGDGGDAAQVTRKARDRGGEQGGGGGCRRRREEVRVKKKLNKEATK